MYYIKYDGEYVLDLVFDSWEDEDGEVCYDRYLHTDKNVKFAMSFESREGANMYVDMFLDNIDYLTDDDLVIVEG